MNGRVSSWQWGLEVEGSGLLLEIQCRAQSPAISLPVLADAEGDWIVRVHHSRAMLEVLSDEVVDGSCERNDCRKGRA